MSTNIQAPRLRAPKVSILSSSDIVDIPGEKWLGGVELYPLSADGVSGTFPVCPMGGEVKDQKNTVSSQSFQAFTIYATDNCSTFGSGGVDFEQRARDKLKVVESYWLESVLWENTDSFGLPSFVNTTSTTLDTGVDIVDGFTQLDSAVANDLHDGTGMIHMTTRLFGLMFEKDLVRREGNVWFSALDNIVVPGRGYTGNGPVGNPAAGTVEWMFGHPGIIQITRDDVMVHGVPNNEMDRAVNDIWVVAERGVTYVIANGMDSGSTGFYTISVDRALTQLA